MSKKSKFFYSIKLNKFKYNLLVSIGKINRLLQNEISLYTYNNLRNEIFFGMSEFTFMKETEIISKENKILVKGIGKSTFQHAQMQVYQNYSVNLNKIKNDYFYRKSKRDEITYFQRAVEYMVKYSNPNKIDKFIISVKSNLKFKNQYLKEKYNLTKLNRIIEYPENASKSDIKEIIKRNTYFKILEIMNKPIKGRTLQSVRYIQNLLISKIKRINYKSLTFESVNNLQIPMIQLSDNLKIANCVINMNIPNLNLKNLEDNEERYLIIPVRYKEKYHGNLSNYKHSKGGVNGCQLQIQYKVVFLPNERKVRFCFAQNSEEIISNITKTEQNNEVMGLDVNLSNNFFALSDSKMFYFDKKLLNKAYRLVKDFSKFRQSKKEKNLSEKFTNRFKRRFTKLSRYSKWHMEIKVNELKEYLLTKGIKHLVIEDLNLYNSKISLINKDSKLKYTAIARILKANDVKNVLDRILTKSGIMVSYVNPCFTSQTCPHCGYISKSNRPNQETFSCKRCGHSDNADINSAINIKMRIVNPELREKLEYFSDNHYIGRNYSYKYKAFYQNVYNILNV